MSQKLLFSDLQNSRIPTSLNICPDDERMYAWYNEADNLLLNQGRWIGSVVEAQFCLDNGCVVWPRQVAAIEQIMVCGKPIPIQNAWYAYTRQIAQLHECPGCHGFNRGHSNGCGHLQMRMKETPACSFATTLGANKLIRSYPGSGADIGKKIIYQGKDINGIWVRTLIDGVMQDGEQVMLSLPFVDTVTTWGPGSPQAVVKEVTTARVLVYEYDTVTTQELALAEYEPGETRPSYKVSYIPGLRANGCHCTTTNAPTTVTALVSLQHIDVTSPGDWLILQNLSAYKAAMIAVKAWEEGDAAKGNFYFYGTESAPKNGRGGLRVVNRGGAIPLLQAELRKQTGDRVNAMIYTDEVEKFPRTMLGFR